MNIDYATDIAKIAISILPFLLGLITFILKNSKNKKWRSYAEKWNSVSKEIQSYIPLAEQFLNYSGKDKKEWVLTKVHQFCINNNIPYEHSKAEEILEHFISLTKDVNKRGTQSKSGNY